MKLALHAITTNGNRLVQQLQLALPGSTGFGRYPAEGVTPMPGGLAEHLGQRFDQFDAHVCVCAVGILTRMLAGLAQDKRRDPAVICIDEQGQFVVPLLSGHRGGANALALRLAELLGGQAVITTASDASQTLAVDLLGAPYGWQLDPAGEADLTAVSAAVVNHQPVWVEQHSGHRQWWPHTRPWPAHWTKGEQPGGAKARILISHRQSLTPFAGPTAIWRPTVLHLGVGCDRGTPEGVIAAAIEAFCQQHDVSPLAIKALHSIDLKADEVGLLALARSRGWPFHTYPAKQLDGIEGIENPSATVQRCIGVSSVAEAASLHGAGVSKLLAPKFKFKAEGFNVTLAACLEAAPEVKAAAKAAKPLKPFRYHLILCGGRHCDSGEAGDSKAFAAKLRRLAGTELTDSQRLKITRSHCIGGCRVGIRAVLYRKDQQPDVNHGLSLQHLEQLSFDQWRQLFRALGQQQPLEELLPSQCLAPEACQ